MSKSEQSQQELDALLNKLNNRADLSQTTNSLWFSCDRRSS